MGSCSIPCCGHNRFAESEFEKMESCKANGIIPVTKYISKSTGLVVIHAEVEGPIVSGYICVVTRAEDDDGLPHILEHMIFLGSEEYPYPGVLEKLANKCLASGTNAWTDVDHSCYTLSTAGSEGFCQLLPIYFDHVFYPLLTDAAYKTEVHHITAKGTDAGVVYYEMQVQENHGYYKAINALYKTLFPPESGYHWNVGGALKNLREDCTNEKVRAFHKKFYHPRNACFIVCGHIEAQEIFQALYRPILKLRKEHPKPSLSLKPDFSRIPTDNRPVQGAQLWAIESQSINDRKTPTDITVHIPVLEEEGGSVAVIGFLGPSCLHASELEEACGLVLILKYLTATSGSPLQQELVEKQQSLATLLGFNAAEYSRSMIYFELEGVKQNDKEKIVPQIKQCLEAQLNNFDPDRMKDIIKSCIQQEFVTMEKAPHDSIAEAMMKEFIYNTHEDQASASSFRRRLNAIEMLENFLSKPKAYWIAIIKNQILGKCWTTVFVEPSANLYFEILAQTQDRVQSRKLTLGHQGLACFALELDEAVVFNMKPTPKQVLKKIKVPSMKTIQYHSVNQVQNPNWISFSDFPANICLDDIKTNFVNVLVVMDTTELDNCFREYLPLFKETIINSAYVTEDGKRIIPYDEAVSSRFRDLQTCKFETGFETVDFTYKECIATKFSCGSFSHLLTLLIQVETDKVDIGMEWVRKVLWKTKWEMERIQVAASKLVGEAYLLKQQGFLMSQVILKNLIYDRNSNVVKSSLLNQIKLLSSMGSDDSKKFKKFENDIRTAFDSILAVITDSNNVSLHIAANMTNLRNKLDRLQCGNLGNLLRTSFPFEACPAETCHSKMERRFANTFDIKWMIPPEKQLIRAEKNQIIYGLLNADSSYMTMVGPAITSYESPEFPALLTLLQYLNLSEGPIYCKVHGKGFGYTCSFTLKVNEGLIYFNLSRCNDLVKAYDSVVRVISQHLSKKSSHVWSPDLLISSKNSLIFECLETERTPLQLAWNSCLTYYRNIPGTYVRTLIPKIAKVTTKDLRRMMQKYCAPLFISRDKQCATVIVCSLDRVDIIKDAFERLGKTMRVFESYDELVKGMNIE